LKLWITSRTVSASLNTTSAILAAGICCAASNTICARRQVTTEPEPRRMIRKSRLPSSLLIERSSTRAAIVPSRSMIDRESLFDAGGEDPLSNPANVAGHTTRLTVGGVVGTPLPARTS